MLTTSLSLISKIIDDFWFCFINKMSFIYEICWKYSSETYQSVRSRFLHGDLPAVLASSTPLLAAKVGHINMHVGEMQSIILQYVCCTQVNLIWGIKLRFPSVFKTVNLEGYLRISKHIFQLDKKPAGRWELARGLHPTWWHSFFSLLEEKNAPLLSSKCLVLCERAKAAKSL